MITSELKRSLENKNIKYEESYDLSRSSSFRIGGKAALAVFPKSEDELIATAMLLKNENVRFEIIGNASNILFGDGVLNLALIFTSGISYYSFSKTSVVCGCGASFTAMAKKAADHGLSGLEFAYGIPGTVGGAVYMNAGAYGSCVSEALKSSRVLDLENGDIFDLSLEDHGFGYRKSIYMDKNSYVCLGAEFELKPAEKQNIYEKMEENISSRRAKQPLDHPNAGSYFKRPEGYFAGKLIEDCGLKGFSVGGAAVSEKHAGFVINLGGATASDVLALETEVKRVVLERFGVELEREVRVIN